MAVGRATDYEQLIERLRRYRDDRDWRQFHNPKDLAIAISTEANELLEHFLWLQDADALSYAQGHRAEILDEIADVAIYLVFLCEALGADLVSVSDRKLAANLERHPPETTRGRSRADP